MMKKCVFAAALILLLAICLCACGQEKADYSFTLTEEQAENYQSAVCHLLKREGEDLYRVQYKNCEITYEDGKLNTTYDGMGIRISDAKGNSGFPILSLQPGDTFGGIGATSLQDAEGQITGWEYLIRAEQDNTAKFVAMLPVGESSEERLLSGESDQLPELSTYQEVFFSDGTFYRPAYDDQGKLLPAKHWEETTWFSMLEYAPQGGLTMEYAPIIGGDYYLYYQVTDKQGNVYCSELIPYKTEPTPPEPVREPDVSVKWEKGARQQLLVEKNGLEVYLSVEKGLFGKTKYSLKVKNNTDLAVYCYTNGGLINGKVNCDMYSNVTVEPGKFVADTMGGLNLHVADGAPELSELKTLQFSVVAEDNETHTPIIEDTLVLLDLTEGWKLKKEYGDHFPLAEPVFGALAGEQILLENEQLRVTLMSAGQPKRASGNTLTAVFKVENLSQRQQSMDFKGIIVNDMFFSCYGGVTVPAGAICYQEEEVWESSLKMIDPTREISIGKMEIMLETYGQEAWSWPSVHRQCVPVTLEKSGGTTPVLKGEILWEQDGVQVGSRGYDHKMNQWNLVLINNAEQDLSLTVEDAATGERLAYAKKAGKGQCADITVDAPTSDQEAFGTALERTVIFKVYDFDGQTLIGESTEKIVLESE